MVILEVIFQNISLLYDGNLRMQNLLFWFNGYIDI